MPVSKPTVVFGLLGPVLDNGRGPERWQRWRPSVAITQQEDFVIDRFELLHERSSTELARLIADDIAGVSPRTKVRLHSVHTRDPWDFADVYSTLGAFVDGYRFEQDEEDYLVHITTGTHVAQICWFLLVESRAIPGRLLQASPGRRSRQGGVANAARAVGEASIIDLDLGKYDRIAARARQRSRDATSLLKAGIDTKNAAFNQLIAELEHVATRSRDPLLLTGETGTGKSELSRRIYALKRARHLLHGPLVAVNCATLRGDGAMSALFGHKKGAFTGAASERAGFLRQADKGVLFLDEVGELGRDEQAMLLTALEEKRFFPLGADAEVSSDFQLIAGTNRVLSDEVAAGRFRADLFARLSLWQFRLPSLRERPEDLAPNLDFELNKIGAQLGVVLSMSAQARARFLEFAVSAAARWPGNFRDFSASVRRMATLCDGGRIDVARVEAEIARLGAAPVTSRRVKDAPALSSLETVLGAERVAALDRFDAVQLADVLAVVREQPSLSAAGRVLFAASRQTKRSHNDADRLRKYLQRFGVTPDVLG